jgi:hypothetical protein
MRNTFKLFVEGFVAEEDELLFKNALQTFWLTKITGGLLLFAFTMILLFFF